MVDFSERHAIEEWMDLPECDPKQMTRTLDELHLINEWLGGYAVSMHGIQTLLPKHLMDCKILDPGCGGGEISRFLQRWARRKKMNLHYIGIDCNPRIIEYARQKNHRVPNTEFLCEDLFNLEAHDGADIVHSSLCLHHFHDIRAIKAVKKMYELCKYGVVINDIHRHPLSYYSIKWFTQIGSRSPMIRHDAPVSVLNAFQLYELYDIVSKAGLPLPNITWHWAFRWLVIIPKRSEVKVKEPVLQPELAATKPI